MNQRIQKGFSLVELMIAILLAAITGIVVLHVLTSFQRRSETLLGSNEAQINAAVGLYAVEKDIRMAGAGLNSPVGGPPSNPGGRLCGALGANIADDSGDVIYAGDPLMPVRILDGGAGPDTLEILRSNAPSGPAPSQLQDDMASADDDIIVDGRLGMGNGGLIMVGSADGIKRCSMMRLAANPAPSGSLWQLTPDTPDYGATEVVYETGDVVINMGTYGLRRFAVLCNDDAAPSATNTCDLGWYSGLAVADPDDAALADPGFNSLAPQIVELQAQYGVAENNRDTVTAWVDATGSWANPTQADSKRIKAVRLSLVARGKREGEAVSPTSLVLWDDAGTSNDRSLALDAQQRRFRYQVLTVVVPLMNVIWADSIL